MKHTSFLGRTIGLFIGTLMVFFILKTILPIFGMIENWPMVVPEILPWPFAEFSNIPDGYIPENQYGLFYATLAFVFAVYSVAGVIVATGREQEDRKAAVGFWLSMLGILIVAHGIAIIVAGNDAATMVGAIGILTFRTILMGVYLGLLTFVTMGAFAPAWLDSRR